MSKKRRREVIAVNTQLIEIYEDLSNRDEEIRLKAAKNLLLSIHSYAREQVHEILRRLVKGLCSGRKAARLGFSVALTELQVQLFGLDAVNKSSLATVLDVIETLEKETRIGGNVSGQEERDHLFGRLFGAKTIIKSGVLFGDTINIPLWSQVLDLIINLARQTSWLREECGWILYQAILKLDKSQHDAKFIQKVIDKIHESGLTKTPEGVAIWIAAMESSSGVKFPKGQWDNDNPMHRKGVAALALILKEASRNRSHQDVSTSEFSQKGNWNPKLHFSWEVVINHLSTRHSYVDKSQAEPSDELDMAGFWDECVDKSLFAVLASNERKYWGFLLFQRIVYNAPILSNYFPFTENLMRCLINQLASSDRYLHSIAQKTVKAVLARAQSDASTTVPIIECLLSSPNGEVNFDHVTKTKTIEKLLMSITDPYLTSLADAFHRLIMSPGTRDAKFAASRRQAFADLLVSALRSRQVMDLETSPKALDGIQRILSSLAQFAYFDRSGDPKSLESFDDPQVSLGSHEMFKARLLSCLTHLTSRSSDPSLFVYYVISVVRSMDRTDPFTRPILSMDEDVSNTLERSWGILQKVCTKRKVSGPTKQLLLTAFKFLFSLAILQAYDGDADAINVLDDLQECYKSLVKHWNQATQGNSDMLIEILLSFVSKPSQLYRRLGQQAFSACTSLVSKSGLQSMFKVLMTQENLSGQENLFEDKDQAENGSEISGDEELDVVSDKTKNLIKRNYSSSEDKQSDVSGSTSIISGSGDDSSESNDELAIFDAKLAHALGVEYGNGDGLVHDKDQSSDEDMDDEQMKAIDKQLQRVFRDRKKASLLKSQKKNAKETVVNFKCRVLELFGVFIEREFTNMATLDILLPLLMTIRTTRSKMVSSKACSVVKDYFHLSKNKNLPKIEDTDQIVEILKSIHCEALKEGSNAFISACSQASLLIAKILAFQDRENLRRVLLVYGHTQEQAMFNPQFRLKTAFFLDWLNWCVSFQRSTTD